MMNEPAGRFNKKTTELREEQYIMYCAVECDTPSPNVEPVCVIVRRYSINYFESE
jgi:hypothetical protein